MSHLAELLSHEPVMAPISRTWHCSCGSRSAPRRPGDDIETTRRRRWREWCQHLDLSLRGFGVTR